MAQIDVLRERPPAYSNCRAKGCGRLIEWVTTLATGRRMPVTAPLKTVRVHEREDGRMVTVIEGEQCHFTSCSGAAAFSTKKASRTRKPADVQGDLFPGERT